MQRPTYVVLVALFFVAVVGTRSSAGPRIDRLIDEGWTFMRSNPVGAFAAQFDDSKWERVSVPHTWNALDGQDGGNDYYRGVGWYRKALMVEDSLREKELYLRFDAVSLVATVFVNGQEVGMHRGGFAAFCFDITPFVRFGEQNVIAVEVSNARDPEVTPLSGDFTVFGGIYRDVHFLATNRLSISPVEWASPGVQLRQREVSRERAMIDLGAFVINKRDRPSQATVRWTVFDREGKKVAESTSKGLALPAQSNAVVARSSCELKSPHLWQGRTDPYLYTVATEVLEDGHMVDRIDQPLGLRSFRVDPEKGFFLNGVSYPLHGVNRHQDRLNMGWAITAKEQREDYGLIEELGCTVVRLPHYQHAQSFYNLCDTGGIVVWAELAMVDHVTESERFEDNCKQQLTELILQNYNHPSICFWSMENELIPDPNPAFYGKIVKDLHELAKSLDPDRLTTVASRSNYDGKDLINAATDVIGYNVYKGWYEGMPEEFAAYADTLHRRFPNRPMAISEYGAGAGTTQHELPPAKPSPQGRWHPEEWQAVVHETIWKAMAQRPYLWGTFVWNMFDFASDGRSEGEQPGRNDKGLVTYDRKIKKDAFYWYKSNWNPQPMVHLTSKRFEPRPAGRTYFKVYSNCASVELLLDGKLLGRKSNEGNIFLWEETVPPGSHLVLARGVGRGEAVVDTCTWMFENGQK